VQTPLGTPNQQGKFVHIKIGDTLVDIKSRERYKVHRFEHPDGVTMALLKPDSEPAVLYFVPFDNLEAEYFHTPARHPSETFITQEYGAAPRVPHRDMGW
jgi:hypothetical protein